MTSASHGNAKRRVWLCAAERTAKRRKSSSSRKNKSRTSRTPPESSSWSPPATVPGPRHPRCLLPLPRRCSATCPTRSPWLRAFFFPRGQGSPAGSRSPAPPRSPADHGRPEQLPGAGGAEPRPHGPAAPARPRNGRKPAGRNVSALPGLPGRLRTALT